MQTVKFFLEILIKLIVYRKKKDIFVAFFMVTCGCVQTTNSSLLKAVSVSSGDKKIVISSPSGFCVDQKLVKKSSGSVTLFIIDCVKVDNPNGIIIKRRPLSAILTATIIEYNNASIDNIVDLEQILTTKPGINYLSKSNSAAMLKVRQIESDKNLLLFLIEQRVPNIGVKQSDYFWRGFFFTQGKIVAMTASNFSDTQDSQRKLKKILLEFANATIYANAM